MIDRFERFTLSIFSISRYWNRIATEEMKRYGLRGAYALYLVILAGGDGTVTAARLAELCQRDKADVSRALSAFQREGLLEVREGARYRAAPVLSEKGKALAAQISGRANVVLEQAGQGLSDGMRETMYQSLDIIAANMKAICERGLGEDTDTRKDALRPSSPPDERTE